MINATKVHHLYLLETKGCYSLTLKNTNFMNTVLNILETYPDRSPNIAKNIISWSNSMY
jgi:hypothetical protein